MEDCAREAGIKTAFVYIEDIGINGRSELTDLSNRPIRWIFNLSPWEFMFREEYAAYLGTNKVNWLVNDKPAGISIREDTSMVTLDLSRFLPHIIID